MSPKPPRFRKIKTLAFPSEGRPNPVDLSFQFFPGGSFGEFNLLRELCMVLCYVIPTEHRVTDYRTALQADRERGRRFALGLFRNGIFLNPMGTKLYLSPAHTNEDIQRILDVSREVLQEIS